MTMTDDETNGFRLSLEQHRNELLSVADSAASASETVELDQTRVGRVSRVDALQQQAMSKESERRRRLELDKIAAALKRIDNGEYGWCLRCEEAIAGERLKVDPAATLCIECARASDSLR